MPSKRALYWTCASMLALSAAGARAQAPACAELGGNILYGVGGSAYTPLVGQVASRVRAPADPAAQLTIVYAEPGECYARAFLDPAVAADQRYLALSPSGASARFWNEGSTTPQTCTLDGAVLADFGLATGLGGGCDDEGELPSDVAAFAGSVSTVEVIVPEGSTQRAISAEAIYFVLAFGDAADVEPWTDERYVVRRSETSRVMQALAAAVGFSAEFAHGVDGALFSDVVQVVANEGVHPEVAGVPAVTVPSADKTIGFVSGEAAASARSQGVRTLAYQHAGQACAYWPDSTAEAHDRLNVRTGRYALWTSLQVYAPLAGGALPSDHVAKLIEYLTTPEAAPPELSLLDVHIDGFAVPQCAMQVSRTEPLGALASFQPEAPCGCYFEARATGASSCEACSDDGDCPSGAPTCRLGFCEAR